jgi:vancomycin resistance protein YoaR
MRETLLSAAVKELPWDEDPEFQAVREQTGCPVLLGAYKTVLHDPLPGEEYNVHLAASYVSGTVLKPGEIFSQNRKAGPYTQDRGFQEGPTYYGTNLAKTIGGGVCKISSSLFNVAVLSDLQIIERHTHTMPVPYVPYGQDATVFYGFKDFKFKNNTDGNLLIWAKGIENILYIGFYGKTAPPEIIWNHEVLKVEKAPVICKKNPLLPSGTENLLHEGMDGALIKSWITLSYPDGTSRTKDFGQVCYKPLPFIKEVSAK